MIDRRLTFVVTITLIIVATAFTAGAQQPKKAPTIGILTLTSDDSMARVVRQGLRELGYVEGQNIVIEHRFAEGKVDRLPDLAAELVRMKVDVIVARTTPVVQAAKNATSTIWGRRTRSALDSSPVLPGRAGTLRVHPPSCRSLQASGWNCSGKFFQSFPALPSWPMVAIRHIGCS